MKKLLFLMLLLFSFCSYAQQTVEICNESNTIFAYNTSTAVNGNYEWTINGTSLLNGPNFVVVDWKTYGAGTYQIEVNFTDISGCVAEPITYDIVVTVCEDFQVWIPTAFSPNDDERNSFFTIKGYGFDPSSFVMEIFNRWGEKLYRTTDINKPWTGRHPVTNESYETGVYTYIIYITDDFGIKHEYCGSVILIP